MPGRMQVFVLLVCACVAGACVDQPYPDLEPQSRVIALWDPLDCGSDPHRVVIELEDTLGVPISHSVPCEIGGLTFDVPHWGVWQGRVYAWRIGPEIRSVLAVRVDVDAPIIHWIVETPR
jgi:hypothetical protein